MQQRFTGKVSFFLSFSTFIFLYHHSFLFYVRFDIVFSGLYAVFYDLSSLGNFFNFSVDIIVLILFGRFMHVVYFM